MRDNASAQRMRRDSGPAAADEPRGAAIDPRATLWRTLQTFNATRIVIALLLVAFLSFSGLRGLVVDQPAPYWQLCSVYLFGAVAFVVLAWFSRERFLLQLSTQITVDLIIISSLYVVAGGTRSGLAILFLFPLAGGAILAPLILALLYTSAVTLVLLVESVLQSLQGVADTSISTAGLYGMAFFAAVLVLNQLASKLIKQEKLAARHGQALRLQQSINRLIIADMGDGILVVGRNSEVVIANPAAERMLGMALPLDREYFRLDQVTALAPIAEAFFSWLPGAAQEAYQDDPASCFVMIKPGDEALSLQNSTTLWGAARRDLAAHLKLRFAKVDSSDQQEERTVIFLQDVTEIENKAQDLKLASMGRLTASIAHEVRNPLSAIAYAASLLEEEVPSPTQTRLLRIIDENVTRLNQMIEDILRLSRKAQPHGAPLSLSPFFADVVPEFIEAHALPPGLISVAGCGDYAVRFDPLHLREVVVNLLSNAVRYASGNNGSIRIDIHALSASRIELHVQDDGVPITQEVRAHLFEPFYTTSSKGTGLGLYLARELCLNNDAVLDYEYHVDPTEPGTVAPSGRFVITFAAAPPH